jgi:Spore photoproduct lyase
MTMYPINPPAVFAHESVMANGAYRAGVERVVAGLAEPRTIETYTDDQLPMLIRERGLLDRRVAMGTLDEVHDPILLFNTFRFNGEEAQRALGRQLADEGLNVGNDLLGLDAFHWANYNLPGDANQKHKVCRPCWRIHLQRGCLHRCAYCSLGGLLTCMVNVDEYCVHLKELMERHPWQKTFLLDDDADPPGVEPELGGLGELIEFFGTLEDRYLIVHTKTWNTDWFRNLKHNGKTIIVWSLSADTQSRFIEPKAGTTEERIEAARAAEEAGYTIRYKFKPIIPVKDWRRDAADAVEMLFARTHPDMISLCTFMWMDIDKAKERLAPVLDLLDPGYLRLAEEQRGKATNPITQPFPDAVRAEIYAHYFAEIRKHHPTIPVSLSTESFQMWDQFAPDLGMTATNYVCGCGPQATPGSTKLTCHPFTTAVRNDQGQVPGVEPPWEG